MTDLQEPTAEQYAKFGRYVAAMFGSAWEWDSELLSDVGTSAQNFLGTPIGDQNAADMKLWRGVADELGIYYEVDDSEEGDEDECPNCGESGYGDDPENCTNCQDEEASK